MDIRCDMTLGIVLVSYRKETWDMRVCEAQKTGKCEIRMRQI